MSNRVKVNADLSVPNHPNIFVVGDTAALTAQRRNLIGVRSRAPSQLRGVARVAIQEGRYVASLLGRWLGAGRVCRHSGTGTRESSRSSGKPTPWRTSNCSASRVSLPGGCGPACIFSS